jgi:hypothetical protein
MALEREALGTSRMSVWLSRGRVNASLPTDFRSEETTMMAPTA